MLEFCLELVVIVRLGESGAVHRPGAHPRDQVEPVTSLEDEVLAGSDLPRASAAAARQHERPAGRWWSGRRRGQVDSRRFASRDN